MRKPEKLSEMELEAIRRWSEADETFGIKDLAEIHVAELLEHIDAINAEHKAEMEAAAAQAREDADRVGAARIAFEDQQRQRIEALEEALRWYADAENYEHPYIWKRDEYTQSEVELDDGLRAREVLAAFGQKANGPG